VLVAGASAQPADPAVKARIDALTAESRCYASPGPGEGETRAICVWRPRNAPKSPLPVLYMADGMIGLHIALADLKEALEAGKVQPMMVVSTNPKERPEDRAAEYLQEYGAHAFETHEKWLLEKVLPWAENTQFASKEKAHRFIGGFSNGADLALALANRHPDVFGGALIHSPVASRTSWVGDQAATQRWVVTGGTDERPGSTKRPASLMRQGLLPKEVASALRRKSATVRLCIGKWEHQGRPWRQLSAGSITWLLQLGSPESVQSDLERAHCRNE
jgi:S-formylglutathione hydrolase FrmB